MPCPTHFLEKQLRNDGTVMFIAGSDKHLNYVSFSFIKMARVFLQWVHWNGDQINGSIAIFETFENQEAAYN